MDYIISFLKDIFILVLTSMLGLVKNTLILSSILSSIIVSTFDNILANCIHNIHILVSKPSKHLNKSNLFKEVLGF